MGLREDQAAQNGCAFRLAAKPESDANFEVCTRILIENEAIVTRHLVRTTSGAFAPQAQSYAEQLGIDKSRIEFQLLMEWPGRSSARWSRWVIAFANTVRSASCSQECRISSGGCSRTRRGRFLKAKFSDKAGPEQLLRDPDR